MGVAGIAAPGIDPESTYSLGQCRLLGAGGGKSAAADLKSAFLLHVHQSRLSGCACLGH